MMPKENDSDIEEVRNKVDQSVENIQPDSDSHTEEQNMKNRKIKKLDIIQKPLQNLYQCCSLIDV